MQIDFIKYGKFFLIFSSVLMIVCIVAMIVFGFKLGIEFTGGSILELQFLQERPSNQDIQSKLGPLNLGEITIQPSGNENVILKTKEIDLATHQKILETLGGAEKVKELRFELIGPVISRELNRKTKTLTVFSLLVTLVYIIIAFRKLTFPRRPWQYGISAIVALIHDVMLPLGVFAVLGKYLNIAITIPIIVALLTIVGYSINDTVVYYDRIRENLFKKRNLTFREAINLSLNQTLFRSLNTAVVVIFCLVTLFLFGGETLRYFALALIIGLTSGSYSSIFIAPPLLYYWPARHKNIKKRK